ncbi:hypothetical protein G6L37_02325 [Agrobacterium rubi]|nr:hypothetical protein [Agrobacterium rubi]NTF24231.1 hypothetical protein [Agrobacterium rubi]
MSNDTTIIEGLAMRPWDYADPQSAGHGETWLTEISLDNAQSRLTVVLTDAQGRKQEVGIEISGREIGIHVNTDVHYDAPLLAAKVGQNEAYVYESLGTNEDDKIIRIDANGFSRAESMDFSDASDSSAKP